MDKYKYSQATSSQKKQGEGMDLLSLLFFMMGAMNVYGHLQGNDNQVTNTRDNDVIGLLKVSVFAMFVAAVIELLVI
ncbi:hypothetical protein [Crocosphaera sp.]|uniref:hypothetical protein n=1 Tax=Crocosphaera sp. TaxID=2729996 RepID=UPI003F25EC1F|nr:hypothetical protein [Crocosphaera sp.]